MNLKEAMTRADQLRPNALPDAQKAAWIYELDGKIARMMEKEPPENSFPADAQLLMPAPYDNLYELYLTAMIDYYHEESALYANDMEMFNTAFAEAKAWWRREHRPEPDGSWRVM